MPYPFSKFLIFIIFFSLPSFVNAKNKIVHLTVEDAASPWSNKDGTGYANDVVAAAFKSVQIDVVFTVVPYARCKFEVADGQSPACFSMSFDAALKNTIKFSNKPIFTCFADYYYNSKKPIKATKESEIPRGIIVGIVNGYEYPDGTKQFPKHGVILEAGANEEANLQKLALGRLDLTIINHNSIKPSALMLEQAGVEQNVAFAFRGGILKSYIGFSTKHPDGEWARKKFNKGFDRIAKSGEILEIEKRWVKKISTDHHQKKASTEAPLFKLSRLELKNPLN